jgi:hypothetical protein
MFPLVEGNVYQSVAFGNDPTGVTQEPEMPENVEKTDH